ncbi:hypothetical protein ACFL5V_09825 [Fibrobacterota bacterium]
MNKQTSMMLILCCLPAFSWACLPPPNIEGVAFTGDETLNWSALESLGEAGANFLKDGEGDTVAYRYISHFSPHAMAYAGNMGLSYLSGARLDCMGIILSESVDPASFDFAEAVYVELMWLKQNNVLDMDDEDIMDIKTALQAAASGGIQYWTGQDTVLGYNAWYTYDEVSGTWDGTGGVRGGDSVNAIDGTYGGCSIVNVAYALPPEGLGSPVSIITPFPAGRTAGSKGHDEYINILGRNMQTHQIKTRGIFININRTKNGGGK